MTEPRAEAGSTGARPEEDHRALAARLVNALYRLVKACQIHAENNQAITQVVEFVVASIKSYTEGGRVASAAILFTPNAVFVNRQMLRASRETYQLALELGQMLEPVQVTEVTLTKETSPSEVAEFGRAVAEHIREGKVSARFAQGGWDGLKLRKVQGLTFSTNLSPPLKAARTYSAALMIVRAFYDDLRRGKYELRQGIKRVAQKLVSQNDAGGRLLLSIAAAPPSDADRAGLCLSTAIVALAMASQLTEDRTQLSALASAALLYDAGRQRLVGYATADEPRPVRVLNSDEEEQLPESTVVALTALGKFHPPSITRAVIVHDALALRTGVPYQGKRPPSMMSRILATARSFAELRVPQGTKAPLSIDDALQVLEGEARDSTERALVKLLIGALGIFPAGTMVELSTGEMGVVLATPALPVDFARPPVRVMYDAHAQLLDQPIDMDLSEAPPPGQPARYVKRPIDTTDQQMKQMRAYVVQVAANRARRHSLDKMRAVMAKGDAPSSSISRGASSSGSPSWTGSSQGAVDPSSVSFPGMGSRQVEPVSVSDRSSPTIKPPGRQFDDRFEKDSAREPPLDRRSAATSRPGRAHRYGAEELAAAVPRAQPVPAGMDRASPPTQPPAEDTEALLAAYLAEEKDPLAETAEVSAMPPSSGSSRSAQSAHGETSRPIPDDARGSAQGEGDRSFGLRWGQDRASAQGRSSPGQSAGDAGSLGDSSISSAGRAFASRGVTGTVPTSAAKGPVSTGRGSVPDRNTAGFGGPGRVTGSAGLRLGGAFARDSQSGDNPLSASGQERGSRGSSGDYSPPQRGGTKLGVGSTGGGSGFTSAAPPPREDEFTFEERPFDAPAPQARPQPLRGSMKAGDGSEGRPGRRKSAGSWAVPPAAEPAPPDPAPEPPPPVPAPDPESRAQDQSATSRRAKAGSMNWGAQRRDGKK